MRMFSNLGLALACIALAACGPMTAIDALASASDPPPEQLQPGTYADKTTLDEQSGLAAELAYQAAALTVSTATKAGFIKGDTAKAIKAADARAFKALRMVRAAYDAGNARSYKDALTAARTAVGEILSLVGSS